MSIQTTLKKINNLLLEIKKSLKQGQFQLPLVRCSREFDFDRKVMVRRNPVSILFKKSSVSSILRIIEILMIIRNLLLNNKFITKRNLYYQLVKYYPSYMLLDSDLLIICDSLKIERSLLNIIVSSKLQLFWFNSIKINKAKEVRVQLSYKKFTQKDQTPLQKTLNPQEWVNQNMIAAFIQKQHILLVPHQIFKIPNCPKLQINILYPNEVDFEEQKKINFLIMEKQSLFEILSESLTYKLPLRNENWFLINSKGYPDMTALQFVNEMYKISKKSHIEFYYIGDYDVYGIDIMLNYAIGNESYEGLWPKLKWICLFDELIQYQDMHNPGFKHKFQQVFIQSYHQLVLVQETDSLRQKENQININQRLFPTIKSRSSNTSRESKIKTFSLR